MKPALPKRVLISAFACSPLRGSEDGIGWHWVLEVARLGYDVTVLSRTHYKSEIDATLHEVRPEGNIRFVYIDLAKWIHFHGSRKLLGYFYIYIWQIHALIVARRLQAEQPFDLVHHITFGGIRFPTFLGALGVPLIFGPLGGGETAPNALRRSYPLRGKIVDALRDLSNAMVRFDPLMHFAFARSSKIVLRTPECVPLVPARYRQNILLERDIGIDCGPDPGVRTYDRSAPRLLFVGRNLYWKGMHLGLAAFSQLLEGHPQARLTIVGDGPERSYWRSIADRLGVSDRVDWIDWFDNRRIHEIYAEHDIFLFPSLHDAGATVIYEAAACRLPIVCLALGAPGIIVDERLGICVPVDGRTEQEVAAALAQALSGLVDDVATWSRMSAGGRAWAETQTWASRVRNVYGPEAAIANDMGAMPR